MKVTTAMITLALGSLPKHLKAQKISREQFFATSKANSHKLDAFARTFIAKCDMLETWDSCYGYIVRGEVIGAFVLTVSRQGVANLQLLHVFAKWRRNGVGDSLMRNARIAAKFFRAKYFRVSAEPSAVKFYMRIGFKFWGEQKSGCQLSMFRFDGDEEVYDRNDEVIISALYRKGKGGIVKMFDKLKTR